MLTLVAILTAMFQLGSAWQRSAGCAQRNFRRYAITVDEAAVSRVTYDKDPSLNGGISDIFKDSPDEITSPRRLSAEGSGFPKWLKGTLLRNGPGLFGCQKSDDESKVLKRFDHVFDGAAKIARYNFNDDGTVDFTTKFLRSNLYEVTAIFV